MAEEREYLLKNAAVVEVEGIKGKGECWRS